jgi:hypothetical protein
MEDQGRMMLYPQNYGMGMGAGQEEAQATSPAPGPADEAVRSHADINTILDQIMNITDQSLDEAQVPFDTTYWLDHTFHLRSHSAPQAALLP